MDAVATQELALRFVPTAADFANPDKLIVAGRTDSSRVLIEVITLVPPEQVQAAGGHIALALRTPSSRELVLELPLAAYGMAEMIVANRGRAGHSFVRFTAVHDLYEVAWSDAEPPPPAIACSASVQPLLEDRSYTGLVGGEHLTLGYVYRLHHEQPIDGKRALFLFDTDCDGVIEGSGSYSTAEIEALGLRDISNWVEMAGVPPE